MSTNLTSQNNKIQKLSKTQKDLELCKLNLERKGLDDVQMDLLESHIKVIINQVLDNLENEQ